MKLMALVCSAISEGVGISVVNLQGPAQSNKKKPGGEQKTDGHQEAAVRYESFG